MPVDPHDGFQSERDALAYRMGQAARRKEHKLKEDAIYAKLTEPNGRTETKIEFASGALSRTKPPDLTKVPKQLAESAARRFDYGEATGPYTWEWRSSDNGGFERGNFKKGAHDPEFVRDRFNHLLKHAQEVAQGEGDAADLDAVACNLAMVLWFRENGTGFAKAFPNAVNKWRKDENLTAKPDPAHDTGSSHDGSNGLYDATPYPDTYASSSDTPRPKPKSERPTGLGRR